MLNLNNKSILYIDNESAFTEHVLLSLQNEFNKVYKANEGDAGLELFYKHRPDIVLTDLDIPYIHATDIIATIKKEFPNQPIVILSGYEDGKSLKEFKEYPYDAFLLKPAKKQELFQTLNKLVA